jgi:hypothetical protein
MYNKTKELIDDTNRKKWEYDKWEDIKIDFYDNILYKSKIGFLNHYRYKMSLKLMT